MKSCKRRVWFLSGMAVLTVPLVAAALAYGCTAAAILSFSPASAPAGGTVTVTGEYFGTHDADDINSNRPAQLRLGSVTGPVLAEAAPSGTSGAFTVNIRIPAGAPVGDTFISATQLDRNGRPVYGTPARQAFRVTGATGSALRSGGGGAVANQVTRRFATLSMASAHRRARSSIRRRKPRAKRIRTRCARRSRTAVACRARFKVGSKSYSRTVVVRSNAPW